MRIKISLTAASIKFRDPDPHFVRTALASNLELVRRELQEENNHLKNYSFSGNH